MFNKVYWDKARLPALVLLIVSIACMLIREQFGSNYALSFSYGYFVGSVIPSILLVQLLAYLSGRTLVDPDKEGKGGTWGNYICWILFEILATIIVMVVKTLVLDL